MAYTTVPADKLQEDVETCISNLKRERRKLWREELKEIVKAAEPNPNSILTKVFKLKRVRFIDLAAAHGGRKGSRCPVSFSRRYDIEIRWGRAEMSLKELLSLAKYKQQVKDYGYVVLSETDAALIRKWLS